MLLVAVGLIRVSILVFWIHFYNNDAQTKAKRSRYTVSILVFLDSLLQRRHRLGKATIKIRFQSLFFWIHFYNGFSGFGHYTTSFVSILVFLDSLLQHARVSAGSPGLSRFQSLFFWIHFYNPTTVRDAPRRPKGFNPCFSGFTSTTQDRRNRICEKRRRFNPCFSGFTSTTMVSILALRHLWRFNPCFSGFTSTTPSALGSPPF